MQIWPFQRRKCHFRVLHLQSLNQKYNKHVTLLLHINFLDAHWTHCGDKVVTNNLLKSYFSFLQQLNNAAYNTQLILLLREYSVVKDPWDILLSFRFSSCFSKHFAKFFKGSISLLRANFLSH